MMSRDREREREQKKRRVRPKRPKNQRERTLSEQQQQKTYIITTTLCILYTLASGMNNILKRLIRFSCDNGKQNREQGERSSEKE